MQSCQLLVNYFLFDRTEFSKLEQQLEDLTGKVIVGGVNLVRMTQLHCKLLQHLFFVRACMCVCAHACVCAHMPACVLTSVNCCLLLHCIKLYTALLCLYCVLEYTEPLSTCVNKLAGGQ